MACHPCIERRLAGILRLGREPPVRLVPLWTCVDENADRFREARQNFDRQQRGVAA